MVRTIEWKDGVVVIIDQTKLPNQLIWVELKNYDDMASAIRQMKLRGAPLIGVAAAYGLALTAFHSEAKKKDDLMRELETASVGLARGSCGDAGRVGGDRADLDPCEPGRGVGGVPDSRRAARGLAGPVMAADVGDLPGMGAGLGFHGGLPDDSSKAFRRARPTGRWMSSRKP